MAMALKIKHRRILLVIAATSVLFTFSIDHATAKKPDCSNDPSHPSCGDDGGGDPGGENACADSMTFPTFVYWDDSGGSGASLTLSDAEGACVVALTSFDSGFSLVGNTAFHYDSLTGSGRVIWTDKFGGERIFLTEFSVDSINNQVTVSPDAQKLLAQLDINSENEGYIDHIDIAPDGDTMVFIYHWPNPEGVNNPEGDSVYLASIAGCADETWVIVDPTGCSNTLNEILSWGPFPLGNGPYYFNVKFNADGSRIFLKQFQNVHGPGTYIAEHNGTDWEAEYWPEIIFPSDTAFIDIDRGNGPESRELLAVGGIDENSYNRCGDIQLFDFEDCIDGISCSAISGSPYLSGVRPSWISDGRLVYQELAPKGKNRCQTKDISIADPFDLSIDPVNLFGGREPLGWN